MSVVTVVQARTASSRLPGKVLLPLAGSVVLLRMLERVRRASLAGTIVVATTTDRSDDVVARVCETNGIRVFRGHPTDLLDRHVAAARSLGAEHVVKIPSDCPLVDPKAIDRVVGQHLASAGRYDYVSNLHPESWPDGNDVEVMTFAALESAWREATAPHEREHTTPFLWDQPERFRIGSVTLGGWDLSRTHRLVLDYPEDYALIRGVYDELHARNPAFGLSEILALLARRPDLSGVNARHRGVNWYRHHLDALRTVTAAETRESVPV